MIFTGCVVPADLQWTPLQISRSAGAVRASRASKQAVSFLINHCMSIRPLKVPPSGLQTYRQVKTVFGTG